MGVLRVDVDQLAVSHNVDIESEDMDPNDQRGCGCTLSEQETENLVRKPWASFWFCFQREPSTDAPTNSPPPATRGRGRPRGSKMRSQQLRQQPSTASTSSAKGDTIYTKVYPIRTHRRRRAPSSEVESDTQSEAIVIQQRPPKRAKTDLNKEKSKRMIDLEIENLEFQLEVKEKITQLKLQRMELED